MGPPKILNRYTYSGIRYLNWDSGCYLGIKGGHLGFQFVVWSITTTIPDCRPCMKFHLLFYITLWNHWEGAVALKVLDKSGIQLLNRDKSMALTQPDSSIAGSCGFATKPESDKYLDILLHPNGLLDSVRQSR